MTDDLTTLVCLFHHPSQAQAATNDLTRAGVPASTISVINSGAGDFSSTTLENLGVPARDLDHLREGIRSGGVVVSVAATAQFVAVVEHIFEGNQASVIDEAVASPAVAAPLAAAAPVAAALPVAAATDAAAIPIVEEELVVGKRAVERGGVRVYRRVVEIPVEQTVNLHEERVVIDRHAVDRPATEQELAFGGERTIELTETAEEVVVGKSAQVVEEVLVGKQMTEHTEHIHDTVRKTEVEVEQVGANADLPAVPRNS